jgi:hypothetical protein
VQGFAEKRYMRRDSVSRLAYGASSGWDVINTSIMKGITDASLAGTGYKAADLNGVRLPGSMSDRNSSKACATARAACSRCSSSRTADLDMTMTGFYSDEREQLWPPDLGRDLQHAGWVRPKTSAPSRRHGRTPIRTASRSSRRSRTR